MKKKIRTLLLILLVVAMFLQPAAMAKAEAKSHHHHHSNKIVVIEANKDGTTRVKFPRNHLTIKDGWVWMITKNTGYMCVGPYTFYFEFDRKGRLLIELYPVGDAGLELPGRGYIPKEYPVRIGHSNVYVYGWPAVQHIQDFYRNHKHNVVIPIESPGYQQELHFVRNGKEWTVTAQ